MERLAGNKQCDETIVKELSAAGITPKGVGLQNEEVPYSIIGTLEPWEFSRNWSYWVANAPTGQGLPKDIAKAMNTIFHDTVRFNGYAGSTDLKGNVSKQGTIDYYQIHTQEGLNAFAAVVKTVRDRIAAATKIEEQDNEREIE